MVNLFLVYFSALLLYTTTILYSIYTYSGGIGNSKLSKVLRETNHRATQRYYYILLLYSIYYIIRTPALKGGSISYILLLYYIV